MSAATHSRIQSWSLRGQKWPASTPTRVRPYTRRCPPHNRPTPSPCTRARKGSIAPFILATANTGGESSDAWAVDAGFILTWQANALARRLLPLAGAPRLAVVQARGRGQAGGGVAGLISNVQRGACRGKRRGGGEACGACDVTARLLFRKPKFDLRIHHPCTCASHVPLYGIDTTPRGFILHRG